MPLSAPAYSGPKEIHYLFVDGGYFRAAAESLARRFWSLDHVIFDYQRLRRDFTKVFYYDCPPPQSKSEGKPEYLYRLKSYERLIGEIHMSDGFHCVEGTTHGQPGKSRQKQVDVKIAVDMLTHAHCRNMHKVTLLTGDLDFKPVLEALVQDGMFVTLWYDPTSTNETLVQAADAKRVFNLRELHFMLDEIIRDACPMPDATGYIGKQTDGYALMRSGKTNQGKIIEHFTADGTHYFVFPNEHNTGHFTHVSHLDIDFLERVFPHLWFAPTWD